VTQGTSWNGMAGDELGADGVQEQHPALPLAVLDPDGGMTGCSTKDPIKKSRGTESGQSSKQKGLPDLDIRAGNNELGNHRSSRG
jgi:hypothetical protein